MHPLCTLAASGRITPTPMSAPLDHSDKRSGIYCIWMPTDPKHRVYVGQSVKVVNRWNEHRSELRGDIHRTSKLRHAYKKYGEAAWVWAVVEEVAATDKVAITAAEQAWMDIAGRDRLFNSAPAAGSRAGYTESAEVRAKIVAAQYRRSPESRAKQAASLKANWATRTPEARAASVAALCTQTPEQLKLSLAKACAAAAAMSPETRAAGVEKLRAANIGRKQSPETIEKRAAALRGKKHSPERIAKATAAMAANRAAKLAEKG